MAGSAAADLAVVRVLRLATGVADGGADHAGQLPEVLLGTPETAHREDCCSGAVRPRRREGRAIDVVVLGDGHRLGSAGEAIGGGGELGVGTEGMDECRGG